jgi:hypothetical protein
VKKLILIWLVGLFGADVSAQVIFRNDFLINNKSGKVENLGLRSITINISNHPNWNQLINGRGGGTLVVDVRALREPRRKYTYSELAEKVYVPATVNGPRIATVPEFLLQRPPLRRSLFVPTRNAFLLNL